MERKVEHPRSKEKAMNDRSGLSLSKVGVEDVANVRDFSVHEPGQITTTAGRTAVISKEKLERSEKARQSCGREEKCKTYVPSPLEFT